MALLTQGHRQLLRQAAHHLGKAEKELEAVLENTAKLQFPPDEPKLEQAICDKVISLHRELQLLRSFIAYKRIDLEDVERLK